MIFTLLILIAFFFITTTFKDFAEKFYKQIALFVSVTIASLSLVMFFQNVSLPGLIEADTIGIFRVLFILILVASIIKDSKKSIIFRKLCLLVMLSTTNIEFQTTFLLAFLVLENKKTNYLKYTLLSLVTIGCLNSMFQPYGSTIVILLLSSLLILENGRKNGIELFYETLFFSVSVCVLAEQGIVSQMLPFFFVLLITFLFRIGKNSLRKKSQLFDGMLSLTLISAVSVSLLNMGELFYLIVSILLLVSIFGSTNSKSVHWKIFFILFSISPPFGIGYMAKVETFERSFEHSWYVAVLVGLIIVLQQFFLMMTLLKEKNEFLEAIRKIKISGNILATMFLALSFLLSLLFLPSNWINGYGNVFISNFVKSSASTSFSSIGSGYYLFWAEIIIWTFLMVVYFKSVPSFFNRCFYSLFLVDKAKVEGKPPRKTDLVKERPKEKLSLNALISVFEVNLKAVDPQYFTLFMLLFLGLMLAGIL